MKQFAFLIGLFLLACCSSAQAPHIAWNVTNNNPNIMNSLEGASGITQATDGGYVFTGYQFTGSGYQQLINVKTNALGSLVWQKTFGRLYRELPGKIRTTSDGGYINVGSTESEEMFACHRRSTGSSLNYYDLWIYKSNAAGDFLWSQCYGSSNSESGTDIRELPGGGYIAVGTSAGIGELYGDVTNNFGGNDMWVLRINATGGIVWSKSFGTAAAENANAICLTADGNCVVAGNSGTDGYAIKVNVATGALIWQQTYTGNNAETLNAVAEDASGNLVFAGTSNSSTGVITTLGGNDVWVLKTTAAGATIWSKNFGSTLADGGNALVMNTDNSVVINGISAGSNNDVTGNYGSNDQWVIKVSAAGNLVWQKNMGSSSNDGGVDIAKTSDGGYITLAGSNVLYTSYDINCPKGYHWAAKLGGVQQSLPAGAILWLKADVGVTSSGGNVSTWADQSGFGNNATVPAGTAAPLLQTDKINGRPVINFGTSKALVTPAIASFGCRNQLNVFMVFKKEATPAEQTLLDNTSLAPQGGRYGIEIKGNLKGTASCNGCTADDGFVAGMRIGSSNSYNATNGGFAGECYQIVEGRFDGNLDADEAQLFINNVRIPRTTGTDNANTSGIFEARPVSIGFTTLANGTKTNFFKGNIAEIIMYPSVLDAGAQAAIYDTLYKKYFSGNNQPFTDLVTATTAANTFTNDGYWKHPFASAATGKAMVSLQDKCNELTTVASTVYVDAAPLYTAPNGEKFLRRHYTIQAAGTHRVRLYFTQQEFTDYAATVGGLTNSSNLTVIKYNGPTEDGVYDISDATQVQTISTVDTGQLYGNRYLEFESVGFGEFWIKKATALPLDLLAFSAAPCAANVCLSWNTANEVNTKSFRLERSTDGIHFNVLETLPAIGSGNNSYQTIDAKVVADKYYYRLQIIDKDGTAKSSRIVSVLTVKEPKVFVYPNPATDYIAISSVSVVRHISICDATGKEVQHYQPSPANRYNVAQLSSGIYFIRIATVAGIQTVRLLIN